MKKDNRINTYISNELAKLTKPLSDKRQLAKTLEKALFAWLSPDGIDRYFEYKGIKPMQLNITDWFINNMISFEYSLGKDNRLHITCDNLEFRIDLVYEIILTGSTPDYLEFIEDNSDPICRMDYGKIGIELFHNNYHFYN